MDAQNALSVSLMNGNSKSSDSFRANQRQAAFDAWLPHAMPY
jgi:hypothetical protein